MAITTREQEMLDRADRGENYGQIAAAMGIKEGSVKRTFCLLSWSPVPDLERERAVREGSRRLIAAQTAANQFSSRRYTPARR